MIHECYLQLKFGVETSFLCVVDDLFNTGKVEVLLILEPLNNCSNHVDHMHEHPWYSKCDDSHINTFCVGGGYNISESHCHGCNTKKINWVYVFGNPIWIYNSLCILPCMCAAIVFLFNMCDVMKETSTYVCHNYNKKDLSHELIYCRGLLLEIEHLLNVIECSLDAGYTKKHKEISVSIPKLFHHEGKYYKYIREHVTSNIMSKYIALSISVLTLFKVSLEEIKGKIHNEYYAR